MKKKEKKERNYYSIIIWDVRTLIYRIRQPLTPNTRMLSCGPDVALWTGCCAVDGGSVLKQKSPIAPGALTWRDSFFFRLAPTWPVIRHVFAVFVCSPLRAHINIHTKTKDGKWKEILVEDWLKTPSKNNKREHIEKWQRGGLGRSSELCRKIPPWMWGGQTLALSSSGQELLQELIVNKKHLNMV